MSPTDMISMIIQLTPAKLPEDGLPSWMGKSAHWLAFHLIEQANSDLAQAIHTSNDLRPFTISNLALQSTRDSTVGWDEIFSIRLTALRADIVSIFLEAAEKGPLKPGQNIQLDKALFTVKAVIYQPNQHPLVWLADYPALAASELVRNDIPSRRISLHFASPTIFQSNGRTIPMPLPEFVFGNLLERWNHYSTIELPSDLRRYAAECVQFNTFNLRSHSIKVSGGVQVGFTGTVSYIIGSKDYDRYFVSLINLLAKYALFAGSGAKTAMGMGQCYLDETHKALSFKAK